MKKILIYNSLLAMIMMMAFSSQAQAQYPWIGIHGSGVFPSGYLSDVAENGYGGGLEIGTFVNPNILVKAMASYHGFGAKTVLGKEIDGAYVPLELGANFYFGFPGTVRPYVTAHGGWFVASGDFKDSEFGMGGGLGLEFAMGNDATRFFVEPNYNIVFQDYDNEEYWGINVGLSFNLTPPSPLQR